MAFKIVLFVAQALLIQAISSQCIGAYNGFIDGYGWPGAYEYGPWAAEMPCADWALAGRMGASWENAAIAERYGYPGGFPAAAVPASNGGGFAVSSSSPIAPNGVSLLSENAIEGPLAVAGEIPFLGTVALEGALPTAGAGGVAYSNGNGNVGIMNEDYAPAYPGYSGALAAGALAAGPLGANALAANALAAGALGAPAYAAGFAGPIAAGLAPGFAPAFGYNRGCGCGRI